MKLSFTNHNDHSADRQRKKFWEEVADREFEQMDDDAKAQWAELR